jgi:16S rRNA (guanine527-N7)-methyltransferase
MSGLANVAKRLSFDLTSGQLAAFDAYYRLLSERRSAAGLTSLTDREAVERRHFGESLALLKALEEHGLELSPAIDIGAGAGFPSVPMKIARPNIGLTLVEATAKKAAFLQELVRELALSSVTVAQDRAEELAHDPAHRGRYRLALARAVAPLPALVELALPFLDLGGYLASPKGSGARREVEEAANALAVCGGRVELLQKIAEALGGPAPTLVLIRKIAETPHRYPRRPGIPLKRPL